MCQVYQLKHANEINEKCFVNKCFQIKGLSRLTCIEMSLMVKNVSLEESLNVFEVYG